MSWGHYSVGLPGGVISNPANPFDVAAGASVSVVFGAASNATTGNFTISAQGSSGALSHSQTLALTVQSGVASMLPCTSYLRTDSVLTADGPSGEPHPRHIAYDPANKQVFVANRAMNLVEVFSSSGQTRIAQISVPAVTSSTQIQAASPSSVVNGAGSTSPPTSKTHGSPLLRMLSAMARRSCRFFPMPEQVRRRCDADLWIWFGSDPTKVIVKIEAAAATVQRVENVATVAPSLALDASYPFPIERITLQTPGGSPGKADIFISAPSGSTTFSKAFQYLQSVHSYAKPALFRFLAYDQPRHRIYFSNIDHVDVFDLQQNLFLDAHSGALRLRIFLPQQFMTRESSNSFVQRRRHAIRHSSRACPRPSANHHHQS